MPTYKSNHATELMLMTRFNPKSPVPRSVSIAPGKHFVAHSSEVAGWLTADEGAEPYAVKVSDAPTDQELFG